MLYTQYIFFAIEILSHAFIFGRQFLCTKTRLKPHVDTYVVNIQIYCYKVVLRKVPEVVISRPIK